MSFQSIGSRTSTPLRFSESSGNLHWEHLSSKPDLQPLVKKFTGEHCFAKIGIKYRCEVLISDSQELLGFFVYHKNLNQTPYKHCFALKKLFTIDPQENLEKKYAEVLLLRVIKLAKRCDALVVSFLLKEPEDRTWHNFLESKGFHMDQKSEESKHSGALTKAFIYLSLQAEEKANLEKIDTLPSSKISQKRESTPADSTADHKLKRQKKEEMIPLKQGNDNSLNLHTKKRSSTALNIETNSRNVIARSSSEPSLQRKTAKTHHLPMKGTEYFDYIISGVKKFEGRVYGPLCKSMQVGDQLSMFDKKAQWGIVCDIVSKDNYPSFEAMLKDKGVLNMLPQLTRAAQRLSPEELIREGVQIYKSFPGAHRVNQQGAVAIGVHFIRRIH